MNESRSKKPCSTEEPSALVSAGACDRTRRRTSSLRASAREQLAIFTATWSTTRLIRRDIGLSGVRSLQDLVDAVAMKRGKPITLTEVPLPPEVSGFCARGRDRDYIVADANASELTRLHVSLHELFHLWEEHPADDGTPQPIAPDVVRQLLPGLRPEPIQKVLGRSHYRKSHERRAETFATVMLQRHLELRTHESRTDYVTSALAHRRTGV
ncbi:ImmA/IrrE family metallo-endopeptidase [Streptomyces sp. NPDC003011]